MMQSQFCDDGENPARIFESSNQLTYILLLLKLNLNLLSTATVSPNLISPLPTFTLNASLATALNHF